MAKNNAEETKTSTKSNATIESAKKEMGPLGFIGTIAGVAVIIVVAVIYFINDSSAKKDATSQDELFQAQYYFEQDSLDLALNGDGRNLGLLSIIDIYGGTEAANLANFYTGAIYLKQGEHATALDYLNDFSSSETLLQARADELTGDAYMELGQYSDAAAKYEAAANAVDDQYFSPGYLMKASLAHENNSDIASALKAVTQIVDKYFGASEYNEARKQKARLEVLASR